MILHGFEHLRYAVAYNDGGRVVSLHQHPDAALRFAGQADWLGVYDNDTGERLY